MLPDEIRRQLERCGFANGEKFKNENEVRAYLNVATQEECFGHEADLTQHQLDEMTSYVLKNKFHMED